MTSHTARCLNKLIVSLAALLLAANVHAASHHFDEQFAKAGVQNANSFLWVGASVEQRVAPDIASRKEQLLDFRPGQYDTRDARRPENLFAVTNKVANVMLERQTESKLVTDDGLAPMLDIFWRSYFGPPILVVGRYESASQALHVRVVGSTVSELKAAPFEINLQFSMPPEQAELLRSVERFISPAVVFELRGERLTARYLDFFAGTELHSQLPSIAAVLRDGVKINQPVAYRFGAGSAGAYDGITQGRQSKESSDRQAAQRLVLAERPTMRWYPLYARIRENDFQCGAIRADIERSHVVNGKSPEGQQRTLDYARRLIAGAPGCVK